MPSFQAPRLDSEAGHHTPRSDLDSVRNRLTPTVSTGKRLNDSVVLSDSSRKKSRSTFPILPANCSWPISSLKCFDGVKDQEVPNDSILKDSMLSSLALTCGSFAPTNSKQYPSNQIAQLVSSQLNKARVDELRHQIDDMCPMLSTLDASKNLPFISMLRGVTLLLDKSTKYQSNQTIEREPDYQTLLGSLSFANTVLSSDLPTLQSTSKDMKENDIKSLLDTVFKIVYKEHKEHQSAEGTTFLNALFLAQYLFHSHPQSNLQTSQNSSETDKFPENSWITFRNFFLSWLRQSFSHMVDQELASIGREGSGEPVQIELAKILALLKGFRFQEATKVACSAVVQSLDPHLGLILSQLSTVPTYIPFVVRKQIQTWKQVGVWDGMSVVQRDVYNIISGNTSSLFFKRPLSKISSTSDSPTELVESSQLSSPDFLHIFGLQVAFGYLLPLVAPPYSTQESSSGIVSSGATDFSTFLHTTVEDSSTIFVDENVENTDNINGSDENSDDNDILLHIHRNKKSAIHPTSREIMSVSDLLLHVVSIYKTNDEDLSGCFDNIFFRMLFQFCCTTSNNQPTQGIVQEANIDTALNTLHGYWNEYVLSSLSTDSKSDVLHIISRSLSTSENISSSSSPSSSSSTHQAYLLWFMELLLKRLGFVSTPTSPPSLAWANDALKAVKMLCHHGLWIDAIFLLSVCSNPEFDMSNGVSTQFFSHEIFVKASEIIIERYGTFPAVESDSLLSTLDNVHPGHSTFSDVIQFVTHDKDEEGEVVTLHEQMMQQYAAEAEHFLLSVSSLPKETLRNALSKKAARLWSVGGATSKQISTSQFFKTLISAGKKTEAMDLVIVPIAPACILAGYNIELAEILSQTQLIPSFRNLPVFHFVHDEKPLSTQESFLSVLFSFMHLLLFLPQADISNEKNVEMTNNLVDSIDLSIDTLALTRNEEFIVPKFGNIRPLVTATVQYIQQFILQFRSQIEQVSNVDDLI